jgi:hypothetical protein
MSRIELEEEEEADGFRLEVDGEWGVRREGD